MVYSTTTKFTETEKKVINLLKEGYTNPEIGEMLHISRHTVKHHVSSVLSKIGAVNRINAIFMLASGGYFKEIE